jgi:hypothetical protein
MLKVLKYALASAGITAIILALYRIFVDQTIDIHYSDTYYIFYIDWLVVLLILLFAFILGGAISTLFKSYSFLIPPFIVIIMLFILAYPSEPMLPRPYIQWDDSGSNTMDSTPNDVDTLTLTPFDSIPQ